MAVFEIFKHTKEEEEEESQPLNHIGTCSKSALHITSPRISKYGVPK